MKKFICFFLVLSFVCLPLLSSCSKAPQYADIEERLKELVEGSAKINAMFFGEGLPTYERVLDPRASLKVHRAPDPNDGEKEILTYYYEVVDPNYDKIIAFRQSPLPNVPFSYLEVLTAPDASREAYYSDEIKGIWCYSLPAYVEKTYELYYDEKDPHDYDYVRDDAEYMTISEMKAAAEEIYSAEYLSAIYESIFVGTTAITESVSGLSARYIEYIDDNGDTWLMKSNNEDFVMIRETRVFDFSTAKIVKPSNAEYINVKINSYLPSDPSNVISVRLSLVLQNGVWMLDSATY